MRPNKRFAEIRLEKAAAQNHKRAARLLRYVEQIIGLEAEKATSFIALSFFTISLLVARSRLRVVSAVMLLVMKSNELRK